MVSCCKAGESLVASGRVPQGIGKVHYVPVVCTLPYDVNDRYFNADAIYILARSYSDVCNRARIDFQTLDR